MNDFNLSLLEWLIGQWEGLQGSGVYHEEWEKVDDKELKGKAYTIKGGEITNPEKLNIKVDDSGVNYIAEVSHNESPVAFALTRYDENTFVFENPNHDFPKKITYVKMNENEFLATVEAEKNGKLKKFDYNLKRIM
ncbi:MAG: DUF6265 family protein [bacterium]|nr:DUF6265 family protein [bacterium]